jgi:hypothetical protein
MLGIISSNYVCSTAGGGLRCSPFFQEHESFVSRFIHKTNRVMQNLMIGDPSLRLPGGACGAAPPVYEGLAGCRGASGRSDPR